MGGIVKGSNLVKYCAIYTYSKAVNTVLIVRNLERLSLTMTFDPGQIKIHALSTFSDSAHC